MLIDFKNPECTIIKKGFLKKRSNFLHLWKTRFCILTNKHLFAFSGISKDADCTMALSLTKCTKVENSDLTTKKNNTFILSGPEIKYNFMCETIKERDDWIKAIHGQLMESMPIKNDYSSP